MFSYTSKESIEMTVKGSHYISSSDTFKSRKLVWILSPHVLILILIYLSTYTGKAFTSVFFKSSILVQIALYIYISNSSLFLSLSLKDLIYPLILGNIKTNGLICKYQIKYLN